uniref:Innexin n=1 Tax=Macrostomum lignano TaxID=282301 RepID=A0A1I8G5P7_9PLAT
MAGAAQTLQAALEQFVRPHMVHASFPVDRFFNKMAFMTTILQAVAIIVANFAAKAKISCTPEGGGGGSSNSSSGSGPDIRHKAYAESYCYSQGVDQRLTPNHTIPADLQGVLNHYLLQFYFPLLFLLQAVSLYMPYYTWSKTVGEQLREQLQFVVDLSLKLLEDKEEQAEGHVHSESCKSRRMQQGRPSKSDVLTDSALKQRLKRWYCKGKHTRNYYLFQIARVTLLLFWISFYVFCPGFRHRDIRYEFMCVIRNRDDYRFMCVLLQASIFELGWTGNLCILVFCLLLVSHQIFYVFPFVFSCRCTCCKTKRCLPSCRK